MRLRSVVTIMIPRGWLDETDFWILARSVGDRDWDAEDVVGSVVGPCAVCDGGGET
jgi:hypothetical protein